MMQKLILLLVFTYFNTYSQSILSNLNSGKSNKFHSNKLVFETVTNITFYSSNGIKKEKDITRFNNKNQVSVEFRYDDNDNLKQRLTWLYDNSETRCVSMTFENWHHLLGHTIETTLYEYDTNGFLIKIIAKHQSGIITRQTNLINNEKGDPVELIGYVNNEIFGRETAEYNYEKNELNIKYFNQKDELINTQSTVIESSKVQPGDITNEYGDIIQSKKYKEDIKYDKFGNWVKKSFFKISQDKFIKSSEETRTIKYLTE